MRFLRVPFIFLAAAMACAALAAPDAGWGTDFDAGKARAAKEKKALLVYFTGSAWCPPCKLLHAELLPSKAFAEFAKDKVLVMLDYPPISARSQEKIKADPALANLMRVKDHYKIPGFPTMLVLGPDGKEKGRQSGFEKGKAPEAYLAELVK
jgi:thiol-disulfide isomerase/thioredoxin